MALRSAKQTQVKKLMQPEEYYSNTGNVSKFGNEDKPTFTE